MSVIDGVCGVGVGSAVWLLLSVVVVDGGVVFCCFCVAFVVVVFW